MDAISRRIGLLAAALLLCPQIQAAPLNAKPPEGFRLTIELRDGSRIVGKSREDSLVFRCFELGETKLPLQKIRSVESVTTNQAKLTTITADKLTVEYVSAYVRVESEFGEVKIPVASIKNLRVSELGKVGLPQDGLVGKWSGDGNAADSVAANNGVLQHVGFTAGVAGQAFRFAPNPFSFGSYSGVEIPDQPAYVLTHSLTMEGWIRPRRPTGVIFFRGDHRPGMDPYAMSIDASYNLSFAINDDNNNSAAVHAPIQPFVWTHIAAVLDDSAGTMTIFTNGVQAAQITTALRPIGQLMSELSPGIGIGNVNDGGNNFPFAGDIDEMGLYNRALSEGEINALYNEHAATATDHAEPLTAQPVRSFEEQ